jgi:hypothetical protein
MFVRLSVFLCLMLAAAGAARAETQQVVIKSSKSGKVTVLFQIDYKGRALGMFCVISANVCRDLPPGQYSMTLSRHPAYTDCDNVDIYPDGVDPAKSEPLGTYGLAYGLWK